VARKGRSSRAGVDSDLEAQVRTWSETARQINTRLVDLRQQAGHFRNLATLADSVKELKGYYVLDVHRWFAAFAAMAIRREMDSTADCHSLRRLLEEIARYGQPVPDFTGRPIDLIELRGYKKRLLALSDKITHIANREIAHASALGVDATMRPTFEELYACIDEFESIAVRYTAYLTGESLLTRDDGTAIPVRLAGQSARPIGATQSSGD
jgi:hypothetical protein